MNSLHDSPHDSQVNTSQELLAWVRAQLMVLDDRPTRQSSRLWAETINLIFATVTDWLEQHPAQSAQQTDVDHLQLLDDWRAVAYWANAIRAIAKYPEKVDENAREIRQIAQDHIRDLERAETRQRVVRHD